MAEIRTLKLNLLADTKDFTKGLAGAQGASKTFAGRIGQSMRTAATAMAVAGAAAGALAVKMGIDAVKSAMEDEASQARLAKTLSITTKATAAQTAAVEKWITSQQYAKGFTDTQLRAAYGRLLTVTKDQTKAQQYLTIAQDVARGTGSDLEQVASAMTKALNGNLGALTRLGVPLSEHTKKTKDAKAAMDELAKLYGGQASTFAETFAGKMATLNQRWDEFKEGIGVKVIGALSQVIPWVQRVIDVMAGNADTSLSSKVKALRRGLDGGEGAGTDNLAYSLQAVAKAFQTLINAFTGKGTSDANSNLNSMADALNNLAGAINAVAGGIRNIKSGWGWFNDTFLDDRGASGTFWRLLGANRAAGARAVGGAVRAGGTYLVGENGPEYVTMGGSGYVTRNGGTAAAGGTTVININGIVDAESARRSIERLIQQSSRRTGAVNWNPVLT